MYLTKKFFVIVTQLLSGLLFGIVALSLNFAYFFFERERIITLFSKYIYRLKGEKTLVDGVRGGWMYNDDRWQGFIDCDFDVTIDLGKETDIKQVCAEFIQLKGPYVRLPKQVIISSSVD